MNSKKRNLYLLMVTFIILVTSCATIMHGTTQRINITSEPPGLLATIDYGATIKTPGEVVLKRNRDHMIEFNNPEGGKYSVPITSSLSGWFFGNFIFLGGW